MSVPIFQVDAFSEQPFGGNPAAVCVLSKSAEISWMAQVAQEMNLSETAFLMLKGEEYELRWFTPTVEVDLCGHATLASAHTLWEQGYVEEQEPIHFLTKSGRLTAVKDTDLIWLDFPAKPFEETPVSEQLEEALGVTPQWCGRNAGDYLVEVASEEAVRALQPHHRLLRTLGLRSVIVTASSENKPYDFVSRFFAPGSGIEEDPVTGSAHCGLGPYWTDRLGKTTLIGFQASARGGIVRVRVQGDRVHLGGQAITVLQGTLLV